MSDPPLADGHGTITRDLQHVLLNTSIGYRKAANLTAENYMPEGNQWETKPI